jgi:flagellin
MKNVGLEQGKASNRLASGHRINSASDDAAGLAISETMRAQIRGLDQASRNSQDASALIQTAEGGMNEITNMLQRVRELTVQAANDTNVDSNREQIALEINQLLSEVDEMAGRVEFSTRKLIEGSRKDNALHFQVGANSDQSLTLTVGSVMVDELFSDPDQLWSHDFDVNNSPAGSSISGNLDDIQGALDKVSLERAKLGAVQNRLEYTMRSLDISSENLSDAESRVKNADMAKEMMRFTMSNVLQQAATSMLAQANQMPNNLLQLIR